MLVFASAIAFFQQADISIVLCEFTAGLKRSLTFELPVRDFIISYKTGKQLNWPSVFWVYFITHKVFYLLRQTLF